MGNLRSVSKALEHVAPKDRVLVTADPEAIRSADRVVVPGQGAMPDCMRQLAESGARDAVIAAARGKPFLGLCIGLQMLRKGLRPAASTTASRAPLAPSWRMQSGMAPWPGTTTRSAARIAAGSAVTRTRSFGATCSSALETDLRLPMP